MKPQRLDDPVAEEAIEWMVRLQSGAFDEQQQSELERWRNRSSHHRQVYQRLLSGLARFQQSPWRGRASQPLLNSLDQPDGRRALLRNALGVCLLLGGVGWLASSPRDSWRDGLEYSTRTAERGSWRLSDGSQLQLNARSRVSLWFDGQQRRLRLHEGEMLIDVAPLGQRPLAIQTASGTLFSEGGRLALREAPGRARVVTLQQAASLAPGAAPAVLLRAGQVTWFDPRGVLQQAPMAAMETAWLQGWLVVHDEPLANLVEALRSYRKGWVRLDPAVAQLRVSGRFPLDDSRQTLEILQQSLPVRIVQVTDYLLLIGQQRTA
ncbi:DUF4880 domain-containing protein [Pantoea sp. Ap-967]|uniref:FecR family protein n=1 Tax=Pantoea sp. Ap-967 TaxID=2608362 RepID=UPI00141E2168|nr:FecR domain-containing protein [Pantoea sp. Ap-967]NIE73370.1 DUF4880 domain-containing protein [Pantoea sp. Ap-967]